MKQFFTTSVGRLRLVGMLEGFSLLPLIFIAVPFKHIYGDPSLVKMIGPIHGAMFVLFVLNAVKTSIELNWKFEKITWKILLTCVIPFGTFYVDKTILSKMSEISQ